MLEVFQPGHKISHQVGMIGRVNESETGQREPRTWIVDGKLVAVSQYLAVSVGMVARLKDTYTPGSIASTWI